MGTYLYRPLLRPAGYATLPPGLKWDYAEVPRDVAPRRPDRPLSRFLYGVIATERPLTESERNTFDLIIHQE
jgi:hypothetical protein